MNILKEGVHTVKDGTIGIGHTLSDGYHNVALAKDKLFRSRPVFDADDEIIGIFEADIKTSLAGLKYLLSQLNHLNRQYWPKLFRANQKIVDTYIKLIGANSLNFKDIDSYYQEFTRWQAEQLTPKVHPKERQFLIESVCRELANYSITMEQLRTTILEELVRFQADVVTPKVKAMMKYLKEILKLIKLRLRKKIDHEKIHKKIAKLMSKTLPLDEKETKELNSLDVLLKQAMGKYNKVNGKLKLILPHAMSFWKNSWS